MKARRTRITSDETGLSPSLMPPPRGLAPENALAALLKTTIRHLRADLQFELFRVQSPLLTESFSFSFPPLTYMLKFSG